MEPYEFIQISAVAAGGYAIVYALDGYGQVWKLVDGGDDAQWTKMTKERVE